RLVEVVQIQKRVRILGELTPGASLNSDDRLVATVSVWFEYGRFTLANVEPVFAKGIQDVWLVRDHNDICARRRHRSNNLTQGCGASIVLDRRNHEPALGIIGIRLNLAEPHQDTRVDCSLEQAGVDVSNRDAELDQ